MLNILLKGLIIGFSIAAPVGPIGLLCINRSLHEGYRSGFVTGVGAATADAVFGSIAAFGLTAISSFLIDHQMWIRLVGGIFMLYLGFVVFRSRPPEIVPKEKEKINLKRAYVTTFFLTLTNPMAILSFIGVFAGLGLGSFHASHVDSLLLVTGVVLGSLFWWLLLSTVVAFFFKDRLNYKALRLVNYGSALIILAFGIVAVGSVIK